MGNHRAAPAGDHHNLYDIHPDQHKEDCARGPPRAVAVSLTALLGLGEANNSNVCNTFGVLRDETQKPETPAGDKATIKATQQTLGIALVCALIISPGPQVFGVVPFSSLAALVG